MTDPKTPCTWGDKRYHSWNYHLREKFGEKVMKISLDAGFTCPNRDGTVARGGCIFCSSKGSGDWAGPREMNLAEQFRVVKERMHKKWPAARYIAYFQAYTNTYGPVERLRELYEQALQQEGVVGLAIATRPDCLPPEVLELLAEINQKTYLWVELGLQTIHDETGRLINRGYDYQCFLDSLQKLRQLNIRTCVHVIMGLPGESHTDMLETARTVAGLPIQGVKIHLLHLMKETPMVSMYQEGKMAFLSQEEYTNLVVDFLELLPPEVVIQRLTGDSPWDLLIEPKWSLKKFEVLNGIDTELKRRNTWQGRLAMEANHD